MTTDPELTRIVRSWLAEDVTDLPDRVLDSVMAELPATPQRRRWLPAWRERSMNTYVRFAAAAAVVSIVVFGGITMLRPGLSGGQPTPTASPAISPTSSPSSLLPLAPAAYCRYLASLEVIGTPGGSTLAALDKAASGDFTDWKRLGPGLVALAQDARQELQGLVGVDPVSTVVDRHASTLDAWIAALHASLADAPGTAEIDDVFSTHAEWQAHRTEFVNAMRQNFETACP